MAKYSVVFYKDVNSLELIRDDYGNAMVGKVIYRGTDLSEAMNFLITKAKELKLTPEVNKDVSIIISDRGIIDGIDA